MNVWRRRASENIALQKKKTALLTPSTNHSTKPQADRNDRVWRLVASAAEAGNVTALRAAARAESKTAKVGGQWSP
jgi:hypothetical protein